MTHAGLICLGRCGMASRGKFMAAKSLTRFNVNVLIIFQMSTRNDVLLDEPHGVGSYTLIIDVNILEKAMRSEGELNKEACRPACCKDEFGSNYNTNGYKVDSL